MYSRCADFPGAVALVYTVIIFCTVPIGVMCSSEARIKELEGILKEKEVEISSLNDKIVQLNKDVELRDEKGMHLMKSYKACSDRLDAIADKEADEGWKPDPEKLLQDLTWQMAENKQQVADLEECEKKHKSLKKKYNALKKKSDESDLPGEVAAMRQKMKENNEKIEHRESIVFEAMISQQQIEADLSKCKKQLETCDKPKGGEKEDDSEKPEKPKLELYSSADDQQEPTKTAANADTSGKALSCQDQLKEALKEAKHCLEVLTNDGEFIVKCKLQKQNIKVSRWFMKKWYYREVARNAELLQQISGMEKELASCGQCQETLTAKVEKVKVMTDRNNKLERRLTECEDHEYSNRARNEANEEIAECKRVLDKTEKACNAAEKEKCQCSSGRGGTTGDKELADQVVLCQESLK